MSLLEDSRLNELAKLSKKLCDLHYVKKKLSLDTTERYSLGVPGTSEKTCLPLSQCTFLILNADLEREIVEVKRQIKILAGDLR